MTYKLKKIGQKPKTNVKKNFKVVKLQEEI